MPRTISSGQPAAGGAASNVKISDGTATGEATVFDYTNSNPVATQLVDSNGDPVSVGGGTQYAQGSASTDTDQLMMAGLVRRDTAAVATGVADGDRLVGSTDSAGRMRVTSADTNQPITAASASIASGAIASGAIASGAIASGAIASGAVASGAFAAGSIAAGAVAAGATSFVKLEDVAFAGGDAGVPAMAIQLATPADTAADGDYAMLQMSAGRLWTSAVVTSNALPTGAATAAKQDSEIALLTTIDADTSTIAGAVAGTEMQVDVLTLPAIPAGNNNIGDVDIASGTLTTVTTVTTVSTLTGGGVADDAADSGNPIKIGGVAKSPDGTDPGDVEENDRCNATYDLNRREYVNTNHPRSVYKHLDGSTAYTDESVFADPGDGFQVVITSIVFATGAATACNFFLEEGATKIFGPIYLEAVAGRGFCTPAGFYLPVTASTAVTLTTSASIAQSFHANGFIQAV